MKKCCKYNYLHAIEVFFLKNKFSGKSQDCLTEHLYLSAPKGSYNVHVSKSNYPNFQDEQSPQTCSSEVSVWKMLFKTRDIVLQQQFFELKVSNKRWKEERIFKSFSKKVKLDDLEGAFAAFIGLLGLGFSLSLEIFSYQLG